MRPHRAAARPYAAAVGYAFAGALVGLLSVYLIPWRVVPSWGVRGASLFLSPLVTGSLMHAYGEFRRLRDLPATSLATFWGGATFAFFLALVRFLASGA